MSSSDLEKKYPKTFGVLAELDWQKWQGEYNQIFSGEVEEFSSLGVFLRDLSKREKSLPPFLAELAALEWSLFSVSTEGDDATAMIAKLKDDEIRAAPSLRVHRFHYDFIESGGGGPEEKATITLIVKNLNNGWAHIVKADVCMAAVLDEIHDQPVWNKNDLLLSLTEKYSFLKKDPTSWSETLNNMIDNHILITKKYGLPFG